MIGGKIRQVIFSSSTKITPGPDRVSFRVLREAYEVIDQIFDALLPALIEAGYHPKCWKEAIGVVLKKPQNPNSPRDYQQPKAYRVISLLNCIGKVNEKIIANRLTNMAEVTDLLHL